MAQMKFTRRFVLSGYTSGHLISIAHFHLLPGKFNQGREKHLIRDILFLRDWEGSCDNLIIDRWHEQIASGCLRYWDGGLRLWLRLSVAVNPFFRDVPNVFQQLLDGTSLASVYSQHSMQVFTKALFDFVLLQKCIKIRSVVAPLFD